MTWYLMLRDKSIVIIGLSARTTDATFCARPLTAPRHRLFGAEAIVNKNMAPVTLVRPAEKDETTEYSVPNPIWATERSSNCKAIAVQTCGPTYPVRNAIKFATGQSAKKGTQHARLTMNMPRSPRDLIKRAKKSC